jgi:hypothetical protein
LAKTSVTYFKALFQDNCSLAFASISPDFAISIAFDDARPSGSVQDALT